MSATIHLPTISALPRVFECPASEVFPHSPTATIYATFGQDVAAFMARAVTIGRNAALDEIPTAAPHRKLCEAIPETLLPRTGHVELAMVYNVVAGTARILGENLHRQYGKVGAMEIAGTADYAAVSALDPETGIIIDHKTGFRWRGAARDDWQLRALALAFATANRLKRVHAACVYLRDDGEPFVSRATFDVIDLASFATALRSLRGSLLRLHRERKRNETPDVRQGAWCIHCPAFDACPAKQGLLRTIGRDWLGIVEDMEIVSEEQAGALWVQLVDFAVPLLKRMKEKLEERARRKPFPTPRGTLVAETKGDAREELNGPLTRQVLTDRYGAPIADAACPVVATKEGVKDAARAHARLAEIPIGEEISAAMAAVRFAGAIVERPGKIAVREIDAPPKLTPTD